MSASTDAVFGGIPLEVGRAPLHRLDSGAPAAVELQLHGPEGTSLHDPAALREAARAMQQKTELDRIAWRSALGQPVSAVPQLIAVDLDSLDDLDDLDTLDANRPTTIVMVTDQALATSPARTLRTIDAARAAGMLIAVDGVGDRRGTLALLPLVEPDVIFLSPTLIHRPAEASTARTAHAVAAYTETTDAVVIARGVDTDLHRRRALGLAAEYGTGLLYAPQDANDTAGHQDAPCEPLTLRSRPVVTEDLRATPFALAAPGRRRTHSRKRLLVSMSKLLEANAVTAGPETIVLGTFQRAEHFTRLSQARWAQLADQVAYTGIYGVGIDPYVDSAVHHAPLDPDDPMVEEWNVVVLGPHFACVLAALDLHAGTADLDREFEYVLSYDRDVVVRCTRTILHRFDG